MLTELKLEADPSSHCEHSQHRYQIFVRWLAFFLCGEQQSCTSYVDRSNHHSSFLSSSDQQSLEEVNYRVAAYLEV